MATLCTHQTFFDTNDDLCYVAQNDCGAEFTFVNFYSTTYCHMNGLWQVFIVLMILFIFLIFRFMSKVVEEYLAPSIEYLTEAMNMSESLGAVTLLALANGAGDVVTAIVASGTPDGIDYNIGALYGAGLFVTTVVVGITIVNSKVGVQLEMMGVLRDVGFYILATTVIIVYGIIGRLTLIDGCILLCLYFVLIIIVVIQEKFFPQHKEDASEEKLLNMNEPQQPQSIMKQKFQKVVRKVEIQNRINNLMILKLEKIREERQIPFSELSFFDKIFFLIDFPFTYVLKATIPPAQKDEYSRIWCCISLAPSLLMVNLVMTDALYWYMLYAILPLGILISIIVWFTYPKDEPIPKYYVVIQGYVTLASLIWTYFVSSILIDLLTFFGMLTNLSTSYLGMTVIAMGNALPDGIVTIALAKQGHAIMGMTGAYVGQLFGLLVGMGLALIRRNLEGLPNDFDLFGQQGSMKENLIMLIVIFTTYFVLIATLIYGVLKKYFFGRDLSMFLVITYTIMFVTVTIIAIWQAIHPPDQQ